MAMQNFPEITENLTQILFAQRTERERVRKTEKEREWGEVPGLTKGANMSYWGANYCDKGCWKERQIKEKVKFALYVG